MNFCMVLQQNSSEIIQHYQVIYTEHASIVKIQHSCHIKHKLN